jgi:hypothetical protein
LRELSTQSLANIARVCHQANKAFCENNNDYSQLDWEECPEWQRDSALIGVQFTINNPDAKASAQHDSWSAEKIKEGWKYGLVKDAIKKEHPCLVEFEQLSLFQQQKDILFQNIVRALK